MIYRVIFYSLLFSMCGIIVYLTKQMGDYPYSSKNMRSAYYAGCNMGNKYYVIKMMDCSEIADDYKQTLDDLDRQINP